MSTTRASSRDSPENTATTGNESTRILTAHDAPGVDAEPGQDLSFAAFRAARDRFFDTLDGGRCQARDR